MNDIMVQFTTQNLNDELANLNNILEQSQKHEKESQPLRPTRSNNNFGSGMALNLLEVSLVSRAVRNPAYNVLRPRWKGSMCFIPILVHASHWYRIRRAQPRIVILYQYSSRLV
jgi:hypothetical protein